MAGLSSKELAASYGWALATMNAVPELKKLFSLAVKKQYTPERFIAEMRSLTWFKKQSEAQRKFLVLKTADPAQYVAQVKQVMASLADQYSQATGEVLSVTAPRLVNVKGKMTIVPGKGFLFDAANSALQLGMNEAQIRDRLFGAIDWKKKIATNSLGGTLSGQVQQMRQQASALGVQPTSDWFANKIARIAVGNDSAEGALGSLKTLAKQRYTAFADRIDAGETMADISEGYRQSYGKLLEVNPGSVDVFDQKIQAALTKRTEDGHDAPSSITDFERELRQDARWQFTNNAKETLMTQGQSVLKSFGLA